MPVPVECPGCRTRLTAPNELLGRKVKCPDCGLVLVVPMAAPRSAPRPAPRPRPRIEEDEEYDDRAGRYERRESSGGGLLIVGLLVGLLVLAGAGAGAWYYFKDKKEEVIADAIANATKSAPPAGWIKFNSPDGSFRVSMPFKPTAQPFNEKGVDGNMYMTADEKGNQLCLVGYFTIPATVEPEDRDSFTQLMISGMRQGFENQGGRAREVSRNKNSSLSGRTASEVVYEIPIEGKKMLFTTRILIDGNKAYMVMFAAESGSSSTSNSRGYFDSFELTSSQPSSRP